jgi:hypothetical protein
MTDLNSENQISTRTGYINRAGKLIAVLPEDTSDPRGFHEGFLRVMLRPGEELIGSGGRVLAKVPENDDYQFYFLDLNGELAFGGRRFYGAEDFSEGRAVVRLPAPLEGYDGLYILHGYIDHSGHMIVKPQFGHAKNFSEGLAAVELAREELSLCYWGYINRQGEFVIEPQYDTAYPFSAGLARVSVNGQYGYIDHSGQMVIEPQFDEAKDFVHGRALAVVGVNGYWGCIDRAGQFVIEPSLDSIENHYGDSEQLMTVRMGGTKDSTYPYKGYEYYAEIEGGKGTFMNAAGKQIIPPFEYEDHWDNFRINDGLLYFKVENKWGCLDTNGTCIIPPKFEDLGFGKNGWITFKQDGLWGILNVQGEIVIPAKFEELQGSLFNEGVMPARQNGHWGFIDMSGEFVIAPEFEVAGSFSEGLASVQKSELCGYIDRTGQIVIPYQFMWGEDFENGLAIASNMDEKSSFINRNGEWLVPPGNFNWCLEFENGAAEVSFSEIRFW